MKLVIPHSLLRSDRAPDHAGGLGRGLGGGEGVCPAEATAGFVHQWEVGLFGMGSDYRGP